MRILTACLVSAVLLGSLTGCGPGPKAQAGQQSADAAITAAGMQDEVAARYSCTGPLPGSEENCGLRVRIATDDFSVLERAAAIDFAESPGSTIIYKGITYDNALDNLDDIRDFEPFITEEMDGAEIRLSTEDGVRLTFESLPTLAELCTTATDISTGWPSASVGSGREKKSAAYWTVEAVGPEKTAIYDQTCAYFDDYLASIDSFDGFGYLLYQVDRDRVLISGDSRSLSAAAAARQKSYAEAWIADHELPEGLTVDLY